VGTADERQLMPIVGARRLLAVYSVQRKFAFARIVVSGNVLMGHSDRLGPQARRFLKLMAGRDRRLFRFDEAIEFWSSRERARQALSRLVEDGWLERIERGLYLIIPLEAGPEGHWTEDAKIVAAQLVPQGAVAYWTALQHWGMTDQIPQVVFVQTRKRKHRSRFSVLGVGYQFVFVAERKFFGVIKQWSDGAAFNITDREKTLIDALDRPDLCGGIPVVAEALANSADLDWDGFATYLRKFASGAVYKRAGYLVETLGVTVPGKQLRLAAWKRECSQGITLLEPRGSRRGPIDSRWRLRVNVSGIRGAR
jgi:predicted transcriptional regulator of viral defense system